MLKKKIKLISFHFFQENYKDIDYLNKLKYRKVAKRILNLATLFGSIALNYLLSQQSRPRNQNDSEFHKCQLLEGQYFSVIVSVSSYLLRQSSIWHQNISATFNAECYSGGKEAFSKLNIAQKWIEVYWVSCFYLWLLLLQEIGILVTTKRQFR